MKSRIEELKKMIDGNCDDYYPTLAIGAMVVNEFVDDSDAEAVANTLECTIEEAEELLKSGYEIDNYETINPENEQDTEYIRAIHKKGTPVYFED